MPSISEVSYNGKLYSIGSLAVQLGIKAGTLYSRWKYAGKPAVIPEGMVCPTREKVSDGYTVDGVHYPTAAKAAMATGIEERQLRNLIKRYGNGREITMADIERVRARTVISINVVGLGNVTFNQLAERLGLNRSVHFYRNRWERAGRPEKVKPELFTSEKSLPTRPQPRKKQGKNNAVEMRDDYLPWIPQGDLAHLSGTKNTGAAVDENAEFYRKTAAMKKSSAIFAAIVNLP